MTLSNFDWTDKASVKWFIMLPTGHEGPYSLNKIEQRSLRGLLSLEARIWAEGLGGPLTLRSVLAQLAAPPAPEEEPELPPLPADEVPPLPEEDEEIQEASETEEAEEAPEFPVPARPPARTPYVLLGTFFTGALVLFALYQWIKGKEGFDIARRPRMSPELHQKILKDFAFEGWSKKIFFKEYVPIDISHIWLATSGFQTCDVEATFTSVKDKLLTLGEEHVAFKTKGRLSDHLVEFSSFDFLSGSRIVPGMYELDVAAEKCEWDGTAPMLANKFRGPEEKYVGRTKVILYANGPVEFNQVLDKLIRKKIEEDLKAQGQEELFWQDLQQKFQTLLAIGLQIEQHLLDFADKDPKQFRKNLPPMVGQYTLKFGHFLTNFVVANEAYFKDLSSRSELKNISQKKNYELMVRLTSKRLGLESMKIIEELQSLKKTDAGQMKGLQDRIKKTFAALKQEINQKIIQVSDDRSL